MRLDASHLSVPKASLDRAEAQLEIALRALHRIDENARGHVTMECPTSIACDQCIAMRAIRDTEKCGEVGVCMHNRVTHAVFIDAFIMRWRCLDCGTKFTGKIDVIEGGTGS